MVDGCLSILVKVVSGVPRGCVLSSLLFLLYTLELFSILLIFSILVTVIPDVSTLLSLCHLQALDLQKYRVPEP